MKEIEEMKRDGVINQSLISELSGLGHGDSFMICDAGFPIPKNVTKIDLALAFNIPTFKQCIKSVLDEVVVEKVYFAAEMEGLNKEGADYLLKLFTTQKPIIVPQAKLAEMAENVKFILRSGETLPYSNIILTAASGVEKYKSDFVIDIPDK